MVLCKTLGESEWSAAELQAARQNDIQGGYSQMQSPTDRLFDCQNATFFKLPEFCVFFVRTMGF